MFITILLFITILAALILVHEFGHFSVAKLFGIRVDEFGLGFPPKIFSKKIGETLYTLNAIPFGGFVKIFGENGEGGGEEPTESVGFDSKESMKRSFAHKPQWVQALVLVAGVTMNILFGYILISLGFMIGMPAPRGTSQFGEIQNPHVVITSVLDESPAQKVGLIGGDIITTASSGKNIVTNLSPETVSDLIAKSQSPITLSYIRGTDPQQTITLTPSHGFIADKQVVGITMETIGTLKLSPINALLQGAVTSYDLISQIITGLFDFFKGLFAPTSTLKDVSGPIGIARVVGEARSIGFVYVLSVIALISFNLAVINLIPFPALDGGRLLFILIEVIIRKKINSTVATWVNGIGFALLLILMVVVTGHDIWNIL